MGVLATRLNDKIFHIQLIYMNYFKYIRCNLLTISVLFLVLVSPHSLIAAPLSGPAASNELNAYGEEIFPDNDIGEGVSESEQAEQFEHARMAFLFGQYKLAFAGWEPLANDGYRQAQATLAWMYHTGKGVKKNHRTAYYWYTRAANQSHSIARNNLGVFYEQGLGVRENLRLAAQNYLDSAQSGYSYAQYNIGMLYQDGRGVRKSKKEAIFWLQIAALQGVTQAQDALESMGRKVVIPQHKKLNKHLKEKSDRPKWHKKKLEATVSSHRKEKTEDIYKAQRNKLSEAAKKASIRAKKFTDKKAKPKRKTVKKQTKQAKPRSRTQQLLARNRALISKKSSSASTSKQTSIRKKIPAKKNSIRSKPPKTLVATNSPRPAITTQPISNSSRSKKLLNDRWVKKQNPKRYTLQIAGSANLKRIKSLSKLLGKNNRTAYFRTKMKGKKWFNLIYGVYSSRSAARKNIKTLPREFKQWSPWIRRFSEVQAKMIK